MGLPIDTLERRYPRRPCTPAAFPAAQFVRVMLGEESEASCNSSVEPGIGN